MKPLCHLYVHVDLEKLLKITCAPQSTNMKYLTALLHDAHSILTCYYAPGPHLRSTFEKKRVEDA